MYCEHGCFKDDDKRTLILRGVNLGGSSKVPATPDGSTNSMQSLLDPKNVSFVGRPFPLEDADDHFRRLETWGLTCIRLVVTWEAVEHKGPGRYDRDFLDYLEALVEKAGAYGLKLIIDLHQDVWSRWTGGDGAPGWTMEAIGIDPLKCHATGAAVVHNQHDGAYPTMIWPTNYTRFGAATMFTLFFGGNLFAPRTKINGAPVQEFLQDHYMNAVRVIAFRLRRFPHVIGYGAMNEPHPGFIGWEHLDRPSPWILKNGPTPTPFQAMLACSGIPQTVDTYSFGMLGPKRKGEITLNPEGARLWKVGADCVWKENGVWDIENFTPKLVRPDYFSVYRGEKIDFSADFLKPFFKRFYKTITSIAPSTHIFLEGTPGGALPPWYPVDGDRIVDSSHWYDATTLMLKRYIPWFTIDSEKRRPVFGKRRVQELFIRQLSELKREGEEKTGGAPVLIGEFGLPFDLNRKKAFRREDFSVHEAALDQYFNAMDANLLSCTLWNYTPDNTNRHGDKWNEEDLSIFSKDQQHVPEDINSGGRAIAGFCRPYAQQVSGTPLEMQFSMDSKEFLFSYQPALDIEEPTVIFVPRRHYPDGYEVNISAGSYQKDPKNQRLLIYHAGREQHHFVIIRPSL